MGQISITGVGCDEFNLYLSHVTLNWALQCEGFWKHLVAVSVRVKNRLCFSGDTGNEIFLLKLYICFWFLLRANKQPFVLYDDYILFLIVFSCSSGTYCKSICPYIIWRWSIFAQQCELC